MKTVLSFHAQRMKSLLASDKANASCRVERGTRKDGGIRGESGAQGRGHIWRFGGRLDWSLSVGRACGAAAAQAACMQGRVWLEVVGLLGAEVARGVHLKHAGHGRDIGRVEPHQRLVERRALPIRNGARTIEGG